MSSAISNDSVNEALIRAKQLAAVSQANGSTTKRPIADDLNLYPSKRSNAGEMSDISRQRSNPAVGGASGAGIPYGGMGAVGPQITHEMLIPGNKCGLIIGKNGETIKSLQETIGLKMLLIQDNQSVSNQSKPLRLTGTPDKVEQAKRAVEQLIAEGGNAAQITGMIVPKSVGEVIVPRSSVGIIIGKGGETIKRLAQESGTKIQFKPDEDPNAGERCAVVQGTPEQITRATQMIWDLVQRSSGTHQQEMCLMHVPANKTGLVIGKGGETIKQINSESGAHVELSRDPPPNGTEKVFVLKGSPYQIHCAQHIIRIKVGDVAPGTPVPPMNMNSTSSFQGGAQQFGGASAGDSHSFGGQQQQQQQWSQKGYGGSGQFNQQNHYQQSQQVPQATHQQQQQIPHGGAQGGQNLAINPSTGQPDYSAQWAEYYRSVGMHEQATLIENQMKGRGTR